MRRRLFTEYGFTAPGHVLPYEQFTLFTDRGEGQPRGLVIDPAYRDIIVRKAETLLDKQYPPLLATDYMRFRRDGNRSVFERAYFSRRVDMVCLATAEYIQGQGRFTDALVNLIWMILEESTWVLPAHNLVAQGDTGALTYAVGEAYTREVDYMDLFAAMTGADMAFVWYLMGEKLEAVSHSLPRRMLFELQRRILRPFTDRANHGKMFWLGIGRAVNNWCPWIVSNVLTVCALVERELSVREDVVALSLAALDTFTSMYLPDGGCDEGPSYWSVAGGALFNACEVLYDMTGGYVNVYGDPLIRNMGEYIAKVYVAGDRYLNFADAPSRLDARRPWGYEWGLRCGSPVMTDFWQYRLEGKPGNAPLERDMPYRAFHQLALPPLPPVDYHPPRHVWLENLQIAVSRQTDTPGRGLYLAFKGGHNGEGHNHNDVGSVIIFADGTPLFLDAGAGQYTRRTFSARRYEIWSMCSEYHNTATFNDCPQPAGGQARAEHPAYDPADGSLSLELTHAHPPEAGLSSYTRRAVLAEDQILLTDTVTFAAEEGGKESGAKVMFSYLCDRCPEESGEGYFILHGHRVSYDPALTYAAEALSRDDPETCDIPEKWDTDTLWRVTLTDAACPRGKARVYRLTVR